MENLILRWGILEGIFVYWTLSWGILGGNLDLVHINFPWILLPSCKRSFLQHTLSNVCPWLLLDLIAKQTLIGNCFLVNSKGIVLSSGLKGMRGIINWFPLYGPIANSATITELFNFFTKWLVYLASVLWYVVEEMRGWLNWEIPEDILSLHLDQQLCQQIYTPSDCL